MGISQDPGICLFGCAKDCHHHKDRLFLENFASKFELETEASFKRDRRIFCMYLLGYSLPLLGGWIMFRRFYLRMK